MTAVLVLQVVCLGQKYMAAQTDTDRTVHTDGNGKKEDREAEVSTGEIKQIALTFDDGPNCKYTPQLLDGLKERDVKATFFLIGKYVEECPDVVKRMNDEGHLIGNHTYDHVEITTLSDEAALKEIHDTNAVIYDIIHEDVEYMRPPFGVWQRNLEEDLDVMPVMWSVDPLDWTTSNTQEIINKVVRDVEDGDIILMHDCYQSSVDAALRIIDILEDAGYEFVTVDELLMH